MTDTTRHFDRLEWPSGRPGEDGSAPEADRAPPPPRRRRHTVAIVLGLIALAIAIFLILFRWDWLRPPLAHYLSARTGREVHIDGHLKVHPFSWTPQATVGGLRIGNPKWAGKGETFQARAVTVKVKLKSLLDGHAEIPLLRLDHPEFDLVRDAQGRMTWKFHDSATPSKVPPIQDFIIDDGHVTYRDATRRLTIDATIQSHENVQGGSGAAFQLIGHGGINRQPFEIRVTGGPLINVHKDRPYRFDMQVRAGLTRITAAGAFPRPFDFGMIDARATASGADLADLYYLTGVPLPNTPRYTLSADVERRGKRFDFHRLTGRIGQSDLSGVLSADSSSGRPDLRATLTSRRLMMTDLAAIFGGKRAGPTPLAAAAGVPRGGASGHILPDARLDPQRIRGVDADLHYTALSVSMPKLPLRSVRLHLTLDHGLLVADPLAFKFPAGEVAGSIRLNARPATPVTDLDMSVKGIRLEHVVRQVQGSAPISGTLLGRARLHGVGDSIYKATATSNGSMAFVVPGGQVRKTFAELMGVNVLPGVLGLISKNKDQTDLRCMVAQFSVANGTMHVQRMVADTSVVRVDGSGSINLVDESLNLRLQGKPKHFQLIRLKAPIDVGGHLAAPKMHVETGSAIAQGGAAVALGALVNPLAAIIPFIDPSTAKNADCSELSGEARAAAARPPARTTARRK